mgnify:CR=1 FL=1
MAGVQTCALPICLTNVLPGRLSRSGDAVRVALDGGEVSLVAANAALPDGALVDAVIRPEQLQLTAQAAQGDNAFAARVVESVFLGSTSEHEILLGTHRLRVQISPSAAWRVGDTVWVRIDPEQIVLLPRSGA